MNFSSFCGAKLVAVAFAPLAVALGESRLTHAAHTVQMPKRRNKIHPLLTPVGTDGAVKEGVDTGLGLVKQGNEIVFESSLILSVQAILPVHGFKWVTNCIHRS